GELLVGYALGGHPRGLGLEGLPGAQDVEGLLEGERGDGRAAVGRDAHEAVGMEAIEGRADVVPAEPQALRQLGLDEALRRVVLAVDDPLPDRFVGRLRSATEVALGAASRRRA